jgi:hypothetical protein
MVFSNYLLNSTDFILFDHNNNPIHDLEFILEAIPIKPQMQPTKMQPQPQPDFSNPAPPLNPSTEFENIKTYLLFSRFKELRQYLQDMNISTQNSELDSIIEFLDIVLLFYTSFSYSDLISFLDSIAASLEEKLKIKLPKRIYSDPAIDGQI